MPNQTFDVGQLISDEGLQLEGGLGNGQFKVRTPSGESRTLDVAAFAKDHGLDPAKLDFAANDPKTAVNISPVGIMDRAAMSLGNAAGKMSYLKDKFSAVKYDADKGIVVNNKGVWQQIDPSGLGGGDAWDMTKELVKDAVDLTDVAGSAIGSTIGAIGGGALGTLAGPGAGTAAGSIAGAGLGGGAAEGIRTSLGRLVGTYEATPEDQLKDIGIEALLNMGGETVGIGAKATMKTLSKAFSNLSANAADGSKDIIAQSVGKITGAGDQATRTVLDQPDAVMAELAQAKIGSRSTSQMIDKLREGQLSTAQTILEDAPKALTFQFGKLKGDLVTAAKDMPSVNIGDLAANSLQAIEDTGLLRRVQEDGKIVFKVMDTDSAIALRNEGKPAAILAENAQQGLKPIVDQLNKFTKLGNFNGPEAASTLMDLKRTVNDIYRDSISPSTPPSVKALLDTFRKGFSNNIGQVFDKAGLTPQYMSTINLYEKFADSVNTARKMAQQDGGAELFVKKMVSDSGANRALKDVTADLAQLMGKRGTDLINSINTKEAAKAFSPILPRAGIMPQVSVAGALGLGAASAAVGAGTGLAAAGVTAAASSPRLALNGIVYGQKALGLLQSLGPSQLKQMLSDPTLLGTFLRTTFTAPLQQEATTQSLVQQAQQAAGQVQQAGQPQQPQGK